MLSNIEKEILNFLLIFTHSSKRTWQITLNSKQMHIPIGTKVEKMFSGIAEKYDFLNHFLSFGIDYHWRNVLANKVKAQEPKMLLDLATGSGDVAFKLCDSLKKHTEIIAVDFCPAMLDQARSKQSKSSAKAEKYSNVHFEHGDALSLKYPSGYFDVVTIAFGVRNFEDRMRGLKEILRVLKPNGSLFILEFSRADSWFRPFYYIYLKCLLPIIAGIVSRDKSAYEYLAGTIENFPSKSALSEQLKEAGFDSVKATGHTFSTVAIHCAIKASTPIDTPANKATSRQCDH